MPSATNTTIAVAQTPYCEWYWNAIKVPESDSAKHHADVYKNAPYEDFREPFLKGLEQWKPDGVGGALRRCRREVCRARHQAS